MRAFNGLTKGGTDRSTLMYLFDSLVKRADDVKDYWTSSLVTGKISYYFTTNVSVIATCFVNKNTPTSVVRAAIDAVAQGKIRSESAMNNFCVDKMFGERVEKIAKELKLSKSQLSLAKDMVCKFTLA